MRNAKQNNVFSLIPVLKPYKMYNVPINNRIIKKPIVPSQHARLMSTNNVRKGGFSKLLLGTLFVSAAGIAYMQTSSRDKCKLANNR